MKQTEVFAHFTSGPVVDAAPAGRKKKGKKSELDRGIGRRRERLTEAAEDEHIMKEALSNVAMPQVCSAIGMSFRAPIFDPCRQG